MRTEKKSAGVETEGAAEQSQLRSEFAETAFWRPHLLTGPDGSASIEFTVPDSVTSWNVWVHAVTRDLKGGTGHKETRSFKDLIVRPYLPRFLREGDKAAIKVVVNNASDHQISGKVTLEILDPVTNESLAQKFGLADKEQPWRPLPLMPTVVHALRNTSLQEARPNISWRGLHRARFAFRRMIRWPSRRSAP